MSLTWQELAALNLDYINPTITNLDHRADIGGRAKSFAQGGDGQDNPIAGICVRCGLWLTEGGYFDSTKHLDRHPRDRYYTIEYAYGHQLTPARRSTHTRWNNR